jgi:hypothetical protein
MIWCGAVASSLSKGAMMHSPTLRFRHMYLAGIQPTSMTSRRPLPSIHLRNNRRAVGAPSIALYRPWHNSLIRERWLT